jgi:hypothetical protein
MAKEQGKKHHIIVDRGLVQALYEPKVIRWFKDDLQHEDTALDFKGEPWTGVYVDFYYLIGRESAEQTAGNRGKNNRTSSSVTISYHDLLDTEEIIRTGQKLISALASRGLRGAVQPHVDKYSELLPAALEMMAGPDELAHSTVMDLFPGGEREPAWVALVRGGRLHISTDCKTHARVFLLGDDPQEAYLKHYSVVRHCLGVLAQMAEEELKVDVFAYQHEYETSELRLNREFSVSMCCPR